MTTPVESHASGVGVGTGGVPLIVVTVMLATEALKFASRCCDIDHIVPIRRQGGVPTFGEIGVFIDFITVGICQDMVKNPVVVIEPCPADGILFVEKIHKEIADGSALIRVQRHIETDSQAVIHNRVLRVTGGIDGIPKLLDR